MERVMNDSGIHPKGARVLVLPEQVEKQSKGGIVFHDEAVKREEMAQTKGVVVEVGPDCWLDQNTQEWAKVGDTIVFGRYAGVFYDGKDGKKYRLINDLDVVATLDTGE
jgi:co-chaperonin GroES (HSP10)